MIEPFSSADFADLNSGTAITTDVASDGMRGFYISNVTPYFFKVSDDLGSLVVTVPPWATVTGSINQVSRNLHITSRQDRPYVQVGGVTPDTWGLEVELSMINQPSQVVQLSVASAANSDILAQRLKQDPASGALPAVQSAVFIPFTNECFIFEIWNYDAQSPPQVIYYNFNQATTGGANNKDLILLPDPNGKKNGAYWKGPIDYTGFWYQGGAGQFTAWYKVR